MLGTAAWLASINPLRVPNQSPEWVSFGSQTRVEHRSLRGPGRWSQLVYQWLVQNTWARKVRPDTLLWAILKGNRNNPRLGFRTTAGACEISRPARAAQSVSSNKQEPPKTGPTKIPKRPNQTSTKSRFPPTHQNTHTRETRLPPKKIATYHLFRSRVLSGDPGPGPLVSGGDPEAMCTRTAPWRCPAAGRTAPCSSPPGETRDPRRETRELARRNR